MHQYMKIKYLKEINLYGDLIKFRTSPYTYGVSETPDWNISNGAFDFI